MGVIDKLKSRMQGPMKEGFTVTQNNTSETNKQDTQVSAPFNSNDSAKMALSLTKDAGKFAAKQGIKQVLKSLGQKALSTAFGVGGALLSSQKAYAGPGENYWRNKELEKQGLTRLTQKDINNMPKNSLPSMSQAEFDEYYKDGIPEMSVKEAKKLGLNG